MRDQQYSGSNVLPLGQPGKKNFDASMKPPKPYKNASSIIISDDSNFNQTKSSMQRPKPQDDFLSQTVYDRNSKFSSSGQNKIPIGMRGSQIAVKDRDVYSLSHYATQHPPGFY